MTGWIVLGAIVLFFLLIGFTRAGVHLRVRDDAFVLRCSVGFVRFQLYPPRKQRKKSKAKPSKPPKSPKKMQKTQKTPNTSEPSNASEPAKRQTEPHQENQETKEGFSADGLLSGKTPPSIPDFRALFDLFAPFLRWMQKSLHLRIDCSICLSGAENPPFSAILYGMLHALCGTAFHFLQENLKMKKSRYALFVNFQATKTRAKVRFDCSMAIGRIFPLLFLIFKHRDLFMSLGGGKTKGSETNGKQTLRNDVRHHGQNP